MALASVEVRTPCIIMWTTFIFAGD